MDLSKLKALALPEKDFEIEVLGSRQTAHITAYEDDISLMISDIWQNYKEDGEYRVRKLMLTRCAGLTEEDADLLLKRDGMAAGCIVGAIFELKKEFDKARAETRADAEKK